MNRFTTYFILALAALVTGCLAPTSGHAQNAPVNPKAAEAARQEKRQTDILPALASGTGTATENPVQHLIERYTIDNENLSRFYTLRFAVDRSDRLEQLVKDAQSQLQQIDFRALTQDARVDYLLLQNYLDHERRQFGHERTRRLETDLLVPFAPTIITLEENRWKTLPLDPEKTAKQLTELAEAIKAIHTQNVGANGGFMTTGAGFVILQAPPVNVSSAISTGSLSNSNSLSNASSANGSNSSNGAKGLDSKDSKNNTGGLAKAVIKTPKVNPVVANRVAGVVQEMRQVLGIWFAHYDSFRPEFAWWCRKPYEAAIKELDAYGADLRSNLAGIRPGDDSVLLGDPIGRTALLDDLKNEMIVYSPEELIQIAQTEMAWCETQMKLAAKQMGQTDWKTALALVKAQHVPPGAQDEFVAQQARDVIAFVDARNLVTIDPLCRETWRIEMASADVQKYLPFAAYGGQKMLVAYPTDQMEFDAKQMSMRGNNKAFTHIVTPHELIPGHYLQGYMAERNRSYRSLFRTPFLVEGWSLYWEMRLWDLGYGKTPEEKVGMLFWRMHRCARILVSLKFHLGQMTPPQMIDYLVERVGHERDGATSEVRRFIGGGYSPLYQVAYMIGGKQLYALHKELVENGKMSERDFHDAVLRQNSIPIEMIRASLAQTPLTSEQAPIWRFADPK